MKPGNITVSLEMAKKLREAGWEKETVFSWQYGINKEGRDYYLLLLSKDDAMSHRDFSAPTFQEIREGLCRSSLYRHGFNFSESLPDAAAEAWLWCKEEGYLD
jgi:hypothetical protein